MEPGLPAGMNRLTRLRANPLANGREQDLRSLAEQCDRGMRRRGGARIDREQRPARDQPAAQEQVCHPDRERSADEQARVLGLRRVDGPVPLAVAAT